MRLHAHDIAEAELATLIEAEARDFRMRPLMRRVTDDTLPVSRRQWRRGWRWGAGRGRLRPGQDAHVAHGNNHDGTGCQQPMADGSILMPRYPIATETTTLACAGKLVTRGESHLWAVWLVGRGHAAVAIVEKDIRE